MSDLISRKDAIEALDFEIVHMMVFSNDDEKNITNPFAQYNKGLEDGIKAIRALPSAEPERKKGKWIEDETGYGYWTCSRCGFVTEASAANILYHFCPNCGARLEWK